MKAKYHVVIIGSGIGGLSAVAILKGQGLNILLIDENAHTGGQLLRTSQTVSKPFFKLNPDVMKTKGQALVHKINRSMKSIWPGNSIKSGQSIDRIHQAQVLGIFNDKRLLVYSNQTDQITEVVAEHIILATGARERYLPFKGWTLPGVMSLGAAQILMKSHGILPGSNTIIAGTSPLMMALTSEILNNRGKVTAVLDENHFRKKLAFLPLIRHHWPKLVEGAFYSAQMALNQVPMKHRTRIVEARGKNKLESVIVAKTSADGRVIPGSKTEYKADTLAIGYGFAPNIELAIQAGCKIEYQEGGGGWVVAAGNGLESSVKSIFPVGEITGIAGAKKSYLQGEIAALSILKKLGKLNQKKRIKQLQALNNQQTDYAVFFNQLCRLPETVYQNIPDDTLICRCEDITMGTIKNAIHQGFQTTGGLKKATRTGMGRCQGRICGPVIQDIIMALTKKTAEEIGPSLTRAPVKNVSIRSFLHPTEKIDARIKKSAI